MNKRNGYALLIVATLVVFSVWLTGCENANTIESGKNDTPDMKQLRKAKKGD